MTIKYGDNLTKKIDVDYCMKAFYLVDEFVNDINKNFFIKFNDSIKLNIIFHFNRILIFVQNTNFTPLEIDQNTIILEITCDKVYRVESSNSTKTFTNIDDFRKYLEKLTKNSKLRFLEDIINISRKYFITNKK